MENGKWTEESLFAFLDERDKRYEEKFIAKEEAAKIAMEASDKALQLASAAIEKRFEGVNEFRAALQDQTANYMPRNEYSVQHKALEEKLTQHILDEFTKTSDQEAKQDEKLEGVKDRLGLINKWLLGLMGGVVVALVLTIVDLLMRGLSQ